MLTGIDHLVLTVADIAATERFYGEVLGVEVVTFEGGRKALQIGRQKINLHVAGREFEPKAERPTPGSGDVCLLTDRPMAEVVAALEAHAVPIIEGPGARTGARGAMTSLYFRDPDQNLIEVATYAEAAS